MRGEAWVEDLTVANPGDVCAESNLSNAKHPTIRKDTGRLLDFRAKVVDIFASSPPSHPSSSSCPSLCVPAQSAPLASCVAMLVFVTSS